MRVSNLVFAIVSLIVLVTTFTAECVGSAKGGTDGKRTSRSVAAELAAAAGAAATTEVDVSNNESIARSLQEDENKKQADITNGSSAGGGPSSEHLARILQEEEDKACASRNDSSPAQKTNKRTFQLRSKAKGSGNAIMVYCCSCCSII